MKTLTEKIDLLLNETSIQETESAYRYPDPRSLDKYKDFRAIQFLRQWEVFNTGERADVYFGNTLISIVSSSQGYFAGIKKSHNCTDPDKQAEFKSLEGKVWFFI